MVLKLVLKVERQGVGRGVRIGRMGKILVNYTYTYGSIDAKHAEKHEEKMEASQEVTGDAHIDKIFSPDFIARVTNSYNARVPQSRPEQTGEESASQEEVAGSSSASNEDEDFEWLSGI